MEILDIDLNEVVPCDEPMDVEVEYNPDLIEIDLSHYLNDSE